MVKILRSMHFTKATAGRIEFESERNSLMARLAKVGLIGLNPSASMKRGLTVVCFLVLIGTSLANTSDPPDCLLEFVSDYDLPVNGAATMEIKRGDQFIGRIFPDRAKIKINGLWYNVPRNAIMVRNWQVPADFVPSHSGG